MTIVSAQHIVPAIDWRKGGVLSGRLFMSDSAGEHDPPGLLTELRTANGYLAGILDIAEDAIVSVNTRQEIVLFNRGAEKTFGFRAAEVLGKSLDLLIPERFVVSHRKDVESFGRGEASSRRMGERNEVYGRRADGREFPADVTISKVSLNGELFFTAIVRDISARKQIEAELLSLNRDLERRVEGRTAELAEGN